jgi:hypothetical protein
MKGDNTMKLREGWKSHGTFWRYKETPMGFSVESVVQFTERSQKKYEAHFTVGGCCGFAESYKDLCRSKKFDNREDAFLFCEQMYKERISRQKGKELTA